MHQHKTREELISELQELQQQHTALKRSVAQDLLDLKLREENLRASEENLSITLHSIGDGVISTDNFGYVVRMNPVAEKLCGWLLADAAGKPLAEVFKIIHAETREPVTDPVAIVLEKRRTVGLANHTVLVSKNGTEYQIADSAAPIISEGGQITGVVLVFSDITETYNAQKQIKESEERYHRLLMNLEVGIVVHAPDTSIIHNNRRATELLGLSDEQMRGRSAIDPAWKFIDESHSPLSPDSYPVNRIVTGKKPFKNQIFGILRPGKNEVVWVSVNGFPVLNPAGDILEIVISFIDITERKQAESTFRDIIEKNPMSIQILDMEGYTIQTNSAHTRLFGVTPPSGYSVFKDEKLLQQGLGEVFERIKHGEVAYFPDSDFNVHDIDPSFPDITVSVKAFGFTLSDHNGKSERIVIMHENITERKKAENMSHDIIENNPISIQIVDKNGITIHGNPAFARLFGAVPPPNFSILDDLQQRSREFEDLILRVKDGEVVHFPDMFYNPHDVSPDFPDKPVWIRAIIFPLMNSSGRPERFVLMHEDFTERWRAANELRQLNETLETRIAERTSQLEATNTELAFHLTEVEQFTYIASHDLQEPLRTLITYTQLVKEEYAGKLDADGLQYLEYISGSATRMRALVSALLEYSLLGKESVITEVDSNKVLGEVLADMSDSIHKNQVTVVLQNLPVIHAYETELRLLFQNLINNAVKFHKTDVLPEIKISAVNRAKDWLFKIEDNGIGIEEKNKEKIFVIFKRMHKRNVYEGAGIGLAHCKKIAELHGGKIWVESAIGVGSTFLFTIPKRD